MRLRDTIELLVLAALWGASFLFMRIAAPEFGPIALSQLRVTIAAMFLLPILIARGGVSELRTNWKTIGVIGVLNSAIPFCLISYSTLYLTGGFAAIINATAPLWVAFIAWIWLTDTLDRSRMAGLLIGFSGVIVLVWDKVGLDAIDATVAVIAGIAGSFFYGIGANFTKKFAANIDILAVATGSMIAAAVFLLPGAILLLPQGPISSAAWLSVVIMGVASTAIAYILYFRLITNVGPAKAITVTFLIPAFAALFGAIFIGEKITMTMVVGCVIIFTGTALTTGFFRVTCSSK